MIDPYTVGEALNLSPEPFRADILKASVAGIADDPHSAAFLSRTAHDDKKALDAEWVHDPIAANKDASARVRPKNAPPDWVRCDFMRNGVRCVKGSGHEKGFGEQAKHEGLKS